MGEFAKILKASIRISKIKYSELAQRINFDSSYVSKWINTDILPSTKVIDQIAKNITELIFEDLNISQIKDLCRVIDIPYSDNLDELKELASGKILKAYNYDCSHKGEKSASKAHEAIQKQTLYSMGADRYNDVLDKIKEFREFSNSIEVIFMGDFLTCSSDDIIFLMDLQTTIGSLNFTNVNFNIYLTESSILSSEHDAASITFLNALMLPFNFSINYYSIDVKCCGMTICINKLLIYTASLYHNKSWGFSNLILDPASTERFFQILQNNFMTIGRKLFDTFDSTNINNNVEMLHAFSGRENQILIGTFDNTLLSQEILEYIFSTCTTYTDELKIFCTKKHSFIMDRIKNNENIDIIMFREAFEKFVYEGTLRMISKEICVPIELRFKILRDLLVMLENYPSLRIKVIDSYIVNEIKHKDLPNLYLSPTNGFFLMFPVNGAQKYSFIVNKNYKEELSKTFDNVWHNGIVKLIDGKEITSEYLNICNEILFVNTLQ